MALRVTIIDADGAHRAALARHLAGAGIEVVADASTVDEAIRQAGESTPTVAVLDVASLGEDATSAADRLLASAEAELAIVAVAPPAHADRVAELAAAGAVGFVLKGDLDEEVAAVLAAHDGESVLASGLARDVVDEMARLFRDERAKNSELQQAVSRFQALSVTDWLTGLKNHGYFFERLGEEIDRALRHRRSLALVVGDLDDFKQVNDAKGHAAGDRVLRAAGQIMLAELRSADVVCRVGGEEFALLLPETDAAGAALVADRIRESLEAEQVPGVGAVTISFGVAAVPEHAIERDDLIESADRALYLAKREGKNRIRIAGDAMTLGSRPVARPLRGEIVELLTRVVRLRSPELAQHSLRTAELAVALGARLGLAAVELERLRVAALLQGIGKVGWPDDVLFGARPLTEDEWKVVHEHPRQGHEVISAFVHEDAASAVLANHEHYDGSGYPRGLRGSEIPFLARVLLVADAYAAMTMDRPFRSARRSAEAIEELRRHAGAQFDPGVVAGLADLLVAGSSPSMAASA